MQAQVKRRIAFGITTGGLLAGGGLGFAHADSTGADGGNAAGTSNSPGVLSGNSVQIPVDMPINVCGVTANVVGLLNSATGNDCSNSGGASASTGSAHGTTGGASAHGGTSGSPGVLSGNNVQVPVHAPVNVCGDSVSGVGVKDTASGNHCSNTSSGSGGASAHGGASDSPGVLSGNNVQAPIDVPVNVCGDTVSVVGILDQVKHNECSNGGSHTPPSHLPPPPTSPSCPPSSTPSTPSTSQFPPPPPGHPSTPSTPPSSGHSTTPGGPQGSTGPGGSVGPGSTGSTGSLAHTGSDALMLAPIGAAMIGGGLVMYRKFKPSGSH